MESARRAEKELGAEVVVIMKTSSQYAWEKDPPPCPSVKVDDAFLVRKGVITYEQFKAGLLQDETQASNASNRRRYAVTAWFYDILDYPWERQYRTWRPGLLNDVHGNVLEAGVGTGRNLKHYQPTASVTAVDFSTAMLKKASRRQRHAKCPVRFLQEDVCNMSSIPSESYDWIVAFFLCCVLPSDLQAKALSEFSRVLKPGGRFRLLEMKYSDDPRLRKRQQLFAPFVAKVYGAGFDRETLKHIQNDRRLNVTGTRYLKDDTYLLIDGTACK